MAIQNFLSGGFYGSIGDLTGRRWKNKRVVQAKFKPKNPRTPAQEEQRRLFTRGSALAKIGQQINWKAPQFDNPVRTDWNQRQTVAINALKNGKEEWEALPTAPDSFKAQHTIGVISLSEITEDKLVKLVLQGTNLLQDKKYAAAIFVNSGAQKGKIYVGSGSTDAGSAENVTLRFDDVEGIKGEECYIKMASFGDTEVDTVTLSAGVFLQQQMNLPYVFEPSFEGVALNSSYVIIAKVKLGKEAIESYDPFTNIKIRAYGKYWTKEDAVNLDILDEENGTPVDKQVNIQRTTVAKSTATVSFYLGDFFADEIEKYDIKLDISFDANNVKGENTVENSQVVQLTAQDIPEYLQEEYPFTEEQILKAITNNNIKESGIWLLKGSYWLTNEMKDAEKVIYTSEDFESSDTDYSELTSVTTQDNKVWSGTELEEQLDYAGFVPYPYNENFEIEWDSENIKSYTGSVKFELIATDKKIAVPGYRVIDFNKLQIEYFNVQATYS